MNSRVLHADALLLLGRIALIESRIEEARSSILEASKIYREVGLAAGVATAFDLFCAVEQQIGAARVQLARNPQPILEVAALVEWTSEAAAHLTGPDQAEWLLRLEERYLEILFALHHGISCWGEGVEDGLKIATSLGRFWWMSGRASTGLAMLRDLLPPSTSAPTTLWADALLAIAGLEYAQARYVQAESTLTEASAMYRQLGNEAGRANTMNQRGMVLRETGNLAAARQHHEEARVLFLALSDERGAVSCLSNLGVVALFEGNLDAAEDLHSAALAERRRLGDARGIASSLGSLATLARSSGDLETAQEMHEEALTMRRNLGDPWGVAGSLVNLCLVAVARGDLAKARNLLSEATIGFTRLGDKLGVCETLDARAVLTAAEDLPAEAVRLLAVAHHARDSLGAPLPPIFQREVDRLLARCKAQVGKKAFDAAWQVGCSPRYSPFPLT